MERVRKRNHVLLILAGVLVALLLCCAASQPVKAETLKTETVQPDGILQNGDLLTEPKITESPEISKGSKARAKSLNSFKAAIKAALDDYWSADSDNNICVDVSQYRLKPDEAVRMGVEFINENPRYFYIGNSFRYTYSDYTENLYFQLTDTPANVSKMLAEYDEAVNEIVKTMDQNWTDLEKALFVNDYIAVNCSYDTTYQNYNAYDVFVNKTAVCQGYALAFLELMEQAGAECEVVTSDKLNHAWNLIKMGNAWYHVDTTWNDPISKGQTKDQTGQVYHTCLLKSTEWFQSEEGGHVASDYVYTGGQNDSAASSTIYDDYFWNKVISPFCYLGGFWYGNENGEIKQYQVSGSDLVPIKILKTITEKWDVWEDPTHIWTMNYSGCAMYDGNLYYVLPTEIHKMDIDGNNDEIVYSLIDDEKSKGYLYGLKINQYGDLTYGIAIGPDKGTVDKEMDLCGHTYGDWSTEAATCETVGMRKQTCGKCGKTKKESLPALGHNYQVTSKIAATCTAVGRMTQTCGRCKDTKVTTTPAIGHKRTKTSVTQPNFVKTGLRKTICADCGATISQKILAKKSCKKGQTYKVGNHKYKIISPKTNGTGTAAFVGVVKDQAKVTIGSKVTIEGASFKITQVSDKALKNKKKLTAAVIGANVSSIGREAFAGAKNLKTITVKSKKLTKVGKNTLKNIHKKAKVKVPSSKLKQYKKLFKNKGQKKTVKITK